MEIKLFEKESDFIPRTYSIENIEDDNFDISVKYKKYRNYSMWLSLIPYIVFLTAFSRADMTSSIHVFIVFIPLLFCHEFCHALFAVISGRKIQKISFFSCGRRIFTSPVAYVKLKFGAYNKTNSILFTVFPLILLSLVPAILAFFIAPIRYWLLLVSAVNIAISYFDIAGVLCILQLPKNCLDFGDFLATPKDAKKPIIIHRLSPSPEGDKIDHICYSFFDGELTEIEPYETEEVEASRQQLVDHLNKQEEVR